MCIFAITLKRVRFYVLKTATFPHASYIQIFCLSKIHACVSRMRDFWSEQGPTDILLKLKRKEITLFRAAEHLNVTPQILSNYLISMSVLDNEANQSSVHSNPSETYDEADSDDEADSILPDVPSNSNLFKMVTSVANHTSSSSSSGSSNSVLANCPDITIIKKEKLENSKVNNNSDHSDRLSGTSEQSQK